MTAIKDLFTAIDAVNANDPNLFEGQPLALYQGIRAEHWVTKLDPDAREALRLAARAHHLRRWEVPRDSYPPGRSGYLRWRRDQKAKQGRELEELLAGQGVGAEVAHRAATIMSKGRLEVDEEVQIYEDAVALTFLETQLVATIAKIGNDEKMAGIVAKTLKKMSPAGRFAASSIQYSKRSVAILARAEEKLRQ